MFVKWFGQFKTFDPAVDIAVAMRGRDVHLKC